MKTRTHMCGQLRAAEIGRAVRLMGWVQRRRDHGGLVFIDLRDHTGITQVVFNSDINPLAHEQAQPCHLHFGDRVPSTDGNGQSKSSYWRH